MKIKLKIKNNKIKILILLLIAISFKAYSSATIVKTIINAIPFNTILITGTSFFGLSFIAKEYANYKAIEQKANIEYDIKEQQANIEYEKAYIEHNIKQQEANIEFEKAYINTNKILGYTFSSFFILLFSAITYDTLYNKNKKDTESKDNIKK